MIAARHSGDDRQIALFGGVGDDLRVDLRDLAHKAEILLGSDFFRLEHTAVQTAQPDRLAAVLLQKLDEVFIDLARKDHLHNVDGFLVRVAHPADKFTLLADLFEHRRDLRAAAVHQHHIDPDKLHQYKVAHHGVL